MTLRVIVFDAETDEPRRMRGGFGDPPADSVDGVRVSNAGRVCVSERAGTRQQVFSIEGEYTTQVMMGQTEPDPTAMVECTGEITHGRSVVELIENVATAHQSVSRTAFPPDPEQRDLSVVERSKPQVLVLDKETLRVLGRFGGWPAGRVHSTSCATWSRTRTGASGRAR